MTSTLKKQTNIFYVDDDTDDQMLFSEAFHQIKAKSAIELKLFTAENGQDFFDVIAKSQITPDITFLDINMPVKDGFECLSEIRATEEMKNVPVIMLSTSESSEVISKSLQLGADKYIVKPPDFNKLKSVIISCLEEFKKRQ